MPQPITPKINRAQIELALIDSAWENMTGVPLNFTAEQDRLSELERDGTVWLQHFYPKHFNREFLSYQKDYWKYVVELGDRRESEPDATIQPRVECEPRGVGKSANLHGSIIYLLARKIKKYVLYVSATEAQAKKHFAVLRKMLENSKLLESYSHLAPQISKHRNAISNWSSDRLVTMDGQVIEFISILGNVRGFNTEEGLRLDFIAFDDVDDQGDTADTVEKKLEILGGNILPAGNETTDIVFAQNLIHRISVCSRLRDNTAGILTNRHFVGPFPLCNFYDYKQEDVEGDTTGAKNYILTDFQPYDPATSTKAIESLLARFGPKKFETECQQNMNLVGDDKDFREYSEIYHVITYDEFVAFFSEFGVHVWSKERQSVQIPIQWNVALGQDFGTTPDHPTGIFPIARPNKNIPLSDSFFCFGEVVLPEYPRDVNKVAELVSPGRVMLAEKKHLKKWNVADSQVKIRRMSHEQSAAKNTYAQDLSPELKTYYQKWKAAKGSGVPQWQNILEIDHTKPHPFRKYPANHPTKANQPLMGKPKFFIVVPREQGELKCDSSGALFVAQPYNADGAARLRAEIPVYSHLNQGADKSFDDMIDAARGVIGEFILYAQEMTTAERYRADLQRIAPELLPENISKVADAEQQSLLISSEQYNREMWERENEKADHISDPYNDWLNAQQNPAEDEFDWRKR